MSAESKETSLERAGYATVALTITEGPERGASFELKAGENIIGRAPECEARLSESEVSRRHVRITIGPEIQVEDLGSAMGTLLNGRLLMAPDFLFDNDEIRIGPYTMRIEIKRQESRRGILIALACLVVALVLFGLAMLFPDAVDVGFASPQQQAGKKDALKATQWRSWETLDLPGVKALETDEIEITPHSAQVQYDFATRLYQDRFGDPGNAYQALLYYKRALAIVQQLEPVETRPTIANRSLERIIKLQGMIQNECKKRIFAFQRAYELKWWDECQRILAEVTQVCPWGRDRYNRWANEQARLLKRMLQG